MIRHTILFKLKPSVSKQDVDSACAKFLALQNVLPGIVTMIGGQCDLHEGKGANIFTHAFSIDFKDNAAMQSFLTDAITHPAKDAILNIAEGGSAGLVGFDLEY
jgi:hypothetical protein